MKKFILLISLFGLCKCMVAQSMTAKDAQFVTDAIQASMLEMKLGELSITSASVKEVKITGQQMINDHTKASNELKALAVAKNLTLPATLSVEGQKIYEELSKKSGVDFDEAYTHTLVKDHEKMVAMFKEENQSGSDDQVKNWASVTLPVLEHHLMMAKDAEAVVNKK